MKKILPAVVVLISMLFSSCATIFTGSKENVQITSVPPAADVEVNGMSRGVTPISLNLKKGFTGQTITIKKEGYETKIFQPETSFNAVSVINLLFIIGWGIDAATGAMMKYDPKAYEIKLVPTKPVSAQTTNK